MSSVLYRAGPKKGHRSRRGRVTFEIALKPAFLEKLTMAEASRSAALVLAPFRAFVITFLIAALPL